ncbi:hypothetical protein SAMN06314019_11118 [Epsilonproteobacteria bacterium SCGC AD-311-C15]|jgi:hypothetical protein|nr:hypothetical protein SAMN06314019_11118 [Epsilonproteobacteria bacterium SCGC AD-311-C15]
MSRKKQLIEDIQNLLNTYDGIKPTSINPDLLEFMDEDTLISIIDSLLNQKEEAKESDLHWLEKFKKNNT